MPPYRPDCLLVALSFPDLGIKLAHIAEGIFLLMAGDHVGGFAVSPLEIAVYAFSGLPVTHFAPALLGLQEHPRVGSEVLRARKPLNIPNLQGYHRS